LSSGQQTPACIGRYLFAPIEKQYTLSSRARTRRTPVRASYLSHSSRRRRRAAPVRVRARVYSSSIVFVLISAHTVARIDCCTPSPAARRVCKLYMCVFSCVCACVGATGGPRAGGGANAPHRPRQVCTLPPQPMQGATLTTSVVPITIDPLHACLH
jgi:hypothetical protein